MSKVTPFDRATLSKFRISSKKLIITYGKGIELKANYHIVLHSVVGGLVVVTFATPQLEKYQD